MDDENGHIRGLIRNGGGMVRMEKEGHTQRHAGRVVRYRRRHAQGVGGVRKTLRLDVERR